MVHTFNLQTIPFILADGTAGNILILKALITCFELVSGFSVNWAKSSSAGLSLSVADFVRFARLLACPYKCWPTEYLGLPLGGASRNKNFWDPVLDRCRERLAWSKASYLSFGGSITLIKAALSNLPMYYLSLFKIHKDLA